jgi:iron-sulfur cluster assembly protein
MAITMTTAAEQHVVKHLQNRAKGIGVRLGVRTTGCSGLSYVLEFVDDAADEDQVFEI